jgi:hypothetical protein
MKALWILHSLPRKTFFISTSDPLTLLFTKLFIFSCENIDLKSLPQMTANSANINKWRKLSITHIDFFLSNWLPFTPQVDMISVIQCIYRFQFHAKFELTFWGYVKFSYFSNKISLLFWRGIKAKKKDVVILGRCDIDWGKIKFSRFYLDFQKCMNFSHGHFFRLLNSTLFSFQEEIIWM